MRQIDKKKMKTHPLKSQLFVKLCEKYKLQNQLLLHTGEIVLLIVLYD